MLVVLVLVLHGLIREEIVQTLEPVVIVVVKVVVVAVTVEVDIGVMVVLDFLEMDPLLLELLLTNEQDLSLMDQGVVLVQTVGAVQVGAVSEEAAVLVLAAVVQEGTLAVAADNGHLN